MNVDRGKGIARMDQSGRIVCLGWGSLIWDINRPFDVKGGWQNDGPSLPLEFARQSQDNRMTLVIVDVGHHVPTLWAELDVASLGDAVTLLAKREDCRESAIGRWPNNSQKLYPNQDAISDWATGKGLSGVVWTALQPGMKDNRGVLPSLAEVEAHLSGLGDAERDRAIAYIYKAPGQIATPYRSALENLFAFGERDERPTHPSPFSIS